MVQVPGGGLIEGERILASNRFGIVTNLAVRYRLRKSLFAGTIEEDLPARHITGVRLETSRHPIWGVILCLIGLPALFGGLAGSPGAFVVAILFLAPGIFLIWGWPKVVVSSGGEPRGSVSWPWTRGEAEAFKNALSKELMERG